MAKTYVLTDAAQVNVTGGMSTLMLAGSVLPENTDPVQLQHLIDNGIAVEGEFVGGLEPVYTGDMRTLVTANVSDKAPADVVAEPGKAPAKKAGLMAVIVQDATGDVVDTLDQRVIDYYRGEANTVGGYTIDGVVFPVKADVPVEGEPGFDPAVHTVAEVQEHLEAATPAEQDRVLEAEAAEKGRVSLLGDTDVESSA